MQESCTAFQGKWAI